LVVDCLEGLIRVAVLEGRAANALRLAAAATSMRATSGEPSLPQRQTQLEQALATAGETLTADQRTVARASGRSLTIEQALARALEGQPDLV
jgi:hypothetical protein